MRKGRSKVYLKMLDGPLNAELCAERFGIVLRRWTSDMRDATKKVAQRINADPRVVKNYLQGRHCPPADKMIALMAESQEFADEINAIVAELRNARERGGAVPL